MTSPHTFHIPVLGIGFSLDTAAKVARYGVSSVLSIVDDQIIEQLRQYYCRLRGERYQPIGSDDPDPRARRVTAYLNLLQQIVRDRCEAVRSAPFEPGSDITSYFEMLPESSADRALYTQMVLCKDPGERERLQQQLRGLVRAGDIDVNIMVKVDKDNYHNGEKLAPEFADAMAALRGYAESDLHSAVVLSAGFNRRLARYIEQFSDFHADEHGHFKKRITLKVSDFRSAFTQAKMFARSGLWISEYRIESGLNCGGHTFSTDGYLMGPVLQEFTERREELRATVYEVYAKAAAERNLPVPAEPSFRLSAQGGVGTPEEHRFLLEHYQIDSVGWGSPFLLVPECVNIDAETVKKLAAAGPGQIMSTGASPLGVPFSNLINSAAEISKHQLAESGRPGSPCPKGFLKFNTEFTELPICTASTQYQRLKLAEIDEQPMDAEARKAARTEVTERACICRDLSGSLAQNNQLGTERDRLTPAVCPGPNLVYFTEVTTLRSMVDHIYGRISLLKTRSRPHMFVNELKLYLADLAQKLADEARAQGARSADDLRTYAENLKAGIEYYRGLIDGLGGTYAQWKSAFLEEISMAGRQLEQLLADSFLEQGNSGVAEQGV
ncbi:MAG: hypothetical protein EA403_13880 [Spirochaetaceae bacterium]|nr:MAG: hypothetical protein EA403_13880 [Spirochaetaceae bacterium]